MINMQSKSAGRARQQQRNKLLKPPSENTPLREISIIVLIAALIVVAQKIGMLF